MDWKAFAADVLEGRVVTREEALAVLSSPDRDLLALLDAAFLIRRRTWGWGVNLHVLHNAKSGVCRENCAFCSQAIGAYSGVERYRMQTVGELVEGAREACRRGAVKYCMVTATRGPSENELGTVCEAARRIKTEMDLRICASLGLLTRDQAVQLREAGVDRFNHNLETSRRYYPEVCQTHTWRDRVETVRHVKEAGMEACCGGIVGMGETLEDRADLALALRELEVESIPVNFLDPRPGTPLGHLERVGPREGLRALCMFRFVNPTRDIRAAGGREVCLQHLQPLALYPANSMFTEGYLTTTGQGYERDMAMIEQAGFHVAAIEDDGSDGDGADHTAAPAPVSAPRSA
jgi:biotin synthase